jgi:hypothetical protein
LEMNDRISIGFVGEGDRIAHFCSHKLPSIKSPKHRFVKRLNLLNLLCRGKVRSSSWSKSRKFRFDGVWQNTKRSCRCRRRIESG